MKLIKTNNCFFLLMALLFLHCTKAEDTFNYIPEENQLLTEVILKTDKAKYAPGDVISFTANKVLSGFTIRYKHLNTVIKEESMSSTSWTWTPPTNDYKGYMVEIYKITDGVETIAGTIAVDVSSDWTKFPRYGFLSNFNTLSNTQISANIDMLKDFHINAIQFYDWQHKHHAPLKMNGNVPATSWVDIANRNISFNTVKTYIDKGHNKNIASMFYNLLYGAWNDYATDGVSPEWLIYNNNSHTNANKHPLPGWLSDIYVTNPGNTNWQNYIFDKTTLVYNNLNFDGWHLDQLGDRGTVYDYNGNTVQINQTFTPFLQNLKTKFPNKKMVLNAVNQYGQSNILSAGVDIAYTEVWDPNNTYKSLADIIKDNNSLSSNQVNTVLAAYMNYDKANSAGFFNTPGVLFTDAVIFAFGGSHLELGEHMLAKEYFPNNNLQMSGELKTRLQKYYDFMVAYENILREGGTFNSPVLNSGDGQLNLKNWPPVASTVSVIGKSLANKQILHLINFSNTSNLNWRDTNGEQTTPTVKKNFTLSLANSNTVSKVWYASPDLDGGASKELIFNQVGGNLVFKVPLIQYWGMIVVEY
ncbi:endo-dextranase [Flavobacterium glycines]|uniref:Cycloisomaltooligosaccharide glucanotransferase n=2 Tax=Flavobacterium glycines TaxID=551990 RepID=A0A1B9DNP6_9FLAO|nr:glycoside hydrolase family 66 protein [Flavobacterium glycines]OCB71303.1 cycloisomaltooligosaccharide glucanotransferase [Flavobacterium glycines]